jgi:hypothetical protein
MEDDVEYNAWENYVKVAKIVWSYACVFSM